ncbi:ribonuclease Y [Deferrisoma camini]|uniref:ribonuclease Y n=1 Tax=Deferrisoma camini TaxID=1035120 RepID=UPI00046CA623|nr:ribonuclease Y [Deferrisoma camini]
MMVTVVVWIAVAAVAALVLGYALGRRVWRREKASHEAQAQAVLEEARKEAEILKKEVVLRAKEEVLAEKARLEQEIEGRKGEVVALERRLQQKEANLEKKEESLERREARLEEREGEVEARSRELEKAAVDLEQRQAEVLRNLEKVAGMSAEEAKEELKASLLSEARHEAAKQIREIEEEARKTADNKAKEIISLAIQRYAGEYVAERTVTAVQLPSDEMKGRIIGREGRNIRAIEAATGVDLIVDDTPETVLLSGYNPVRREVARIALERLIADGRIHPARIEEMVKKVSKEVEREIREAGEQATFDVGVHGIHGEVVNLLGRLKFRSSFAQNVLTHSLEVAFLCGIMAAELGINVKKAKRAGLLHDIGKAVDHEVEGSHAAIGADLARKYGEASDIVHAIAAHHDEVKPETVLAVLVQAADALSAARPGARREMLESYVKRLEDLERIANGFEGVAKSYAIQAGREIRIIVNSDRVDDDRATLLARDVARKVESQLSYPGQIKVTVIRETRAVDYAK